MIKRAVVTTVLILVCIGIVLGITAYRMKPGVAVASMLPSVEFIDLQGGKVKPPAFGG